MDVHPYPPGHINPDEAFHLQQRDPKVLIIDIRPRIAYDVGHIRGAVSLPVDDVEELWGVARGKSLVAVYGQTSDDEDVEWAARALLAHGIEAVVVLEGGYDAWVEAKFPTENETHYQRPPGRARIVSYPAVLEPAPSGMGEYDENPVGISPEGPTGRIFGHGDDPVETLADEREEIERFLDHGA